jgi:uncharacterized membrane protein
VAASAAAGGDNRSPAVRAHLRRRVGSRAWTIPAAYAAVAIGIGFVLPRHEQRVWLDLSSGMSPSSAIAIYSTIAAGTMTLSAIVFSLTFVMVQFSATAYSPRLVLWLAETPVLSHALGIFTGTYLYCISAIAWVDRNNIHGVPFVSAVVAIAWLLASIGAFIALIRGVAVLQVRRMLAFTGDQGRRVIAALYSADGSPAPDDEQAISINGPPTQVLVHTGRPRAVQAIEASALLNLARAAHARIEVVVAAGDTVLDSTPLLRVYGTGTPVADRALRAAVHLGQDRTFEQDPKYAIRLLVDIAIRALSAAINDPTTAVQALDEISDLLLRLGRCSLSTTPLRDSAGTVRVVIPRPSWDDFLQLALDEILAYGASSVQVMRRMNALLSELRATAPASRHRAIEYWQRRVETSINSHFVDLDQRNEAFVHDRQGLGVTRRPAA